ncbi:MAG TPA: arsenate reductase (thioredoxin) [Gammaproteobacteria bacterium]|nr:arsenate reductase (thioredoxin) [Gammaproteobacteria bacterium]
MKLLFLCTGNACRSQMAEGWARTLASDEFDVYSAGIEAHGLNPRAVAVMQEAGLDISSQESTRLSDDMLEQMDYVVTVCGHADELCPALPPGVRKEHWPLSDPAKAEGAEEEIMQVFRHSRDDIKQRVQKLIERLTKESGA